MEALKEIVKTRFDAVFLDISMPNITGLRITDSIIQIEPKHLSFFKQLMKSLHLKLSKRWNRVFSKTNTK